MAKDTEKITKQTGMSGHFTCKGTRIRIILDPLSEIMRTEWSEGFRVMKENHQTRIPYSTKLSFKCKREMKIFLDEEQLKKLIIEKISSARNVKRNSLGKRKVQVRNSELHKERATEELKETTICLLKVCLFDIKVILSSRWLRNNKHKKSSLYPSLFWLKAGYEFSFYWRHTFNSLKVALGESTNAFCSISFLP